MPSYVSPRTHQPTPPSPCHHHLQPRVGAGLALVAAFDTIIDLQYFRRTSQTADMVYQEMITCGPYGQASVALQASDKAVQAGSFTAHDFDQLLTARAAGLFAFIGHFTGLLG
ncbi:hypothetical protein PDIG_62950 [Penicillium digitatum PHI26]|uniref:Uncharacterized protein n=2 Tax=Penicillium digitatum TaxID=36651 RepID=K9FIK7_PEND2|nr:hypothetical protein PDIP_72330 [Penicillium digitatum Pd1]EKV07740.1 hypothetical protein PDIP_72330 [Penicillium digitatum Pd1]EKV09345.1 hypothetical protein PDIG_62950 [Penicillium digitatum PHI26]